MNAPKRLCRSRQNRQLAGVCGGIAEYLGWDPTLVRVAWIILTLLGGSGILIYLILWLVMTESPCLTRSNTRSFPMDYDRYDRVRAVQWRGDQLRLLDQRLLPQEEHWIACRDAGEVTQAIRDLAVRGAPAIGIAAAWGVVLAAQQGSALDDALAQLRAARPTAVNLMWALDRMKP